MANLILRPTADGNYTTWDGFSPGPHTPLYDLINEKDYVVGTGDNAYISTASPDAAFTISCSGATAGNWPRATRIASIRVVAVVRQIGAGCDFSFRLRSLNQDIDTPPITLMSTTYTEVGHTFNLGLNAYAWDVPTINRLEAGLVFASGDEMRCTKLEIYVHYEPFPHYTLLPEADGAAQDWNQVPSTSPAYMTVGGVHDGDLSYLADTTVNNQSVFVTGDLPAVLNPPNIDRVAVKALVKNVGSVMEEADALLYSAAGYYNGGTNTTSIQIQPDGEWNLLTEEYLNDPNVAWPSGHPAATAWTATEVNALQIGIENSGGGDFRCTSVAAEVWLASAPITSIDLFPTADGYHQDWGSVVGAPTAWQATDEDPPDNATSYITLDANTLGISAYSSFAVGGAGAVPAGERVSNVEVRCRIRLDNLPHSEALVAAVVRDTVTGETYVGKPQLLEGTAAIWFDVKQDFPTQPHTGLPWVDLAAVTILEYGFVVLEGAMMLSRVRAQVHTVQDYRSASVNTTDVKLTAAAEAFILRSKTDGTIYGVTEFSVGTGGYLAAAPATVTVVNPTDIALLNEIHRDGVDRIEYDGVAASPTVDYWCRVPREVAQGGVGELALWAEIFWSPIAGEIGTKFLYCLAHHPCQTRHVDDVHFYKARLTYQDMGLELLVDGDAEAGPGPELMVDGDMEAVGVAAWTAGAGAALTKSVVLPHAGLQALRVTDTGGATPRASQAILTIDTTYRFYGWARGDGGTSVPRIYDHALVLLWSGTSSAVWQEIDITFVQTGGADIYLYGATSALGWVEFDDVSAMATCPAWTSGNSAELTKNTTDPFEGLQCLRVGYSSVMFPWTQQTILTIGTLYRVMGKARGNGMKIPNVNDGPHSIWTGTASTSWQAIDEIFIPTTTNIVLQNISGSDYVEFDDMSVRQVTTFDFLVHGAELLVDGDAEDAGVAAWAVGNVPLVTKTPGSAAGVGAQLLRVAYTAVGDPYVSQTVLTPGTLYRIQGDARGDGIAYPQIWNPIHGIVWTGSWVSAWEHFDVVWEAAAADVWFQTLVGAAGHCEWDNVTIKAVTVP